MEDKLPSLTDRDLRIDTIVGSGEFIGASIPADRHKSLLIDEAFAN